MITTDEPRAGSRAGDGSSDLRVRPPATETAGQKEVISTPASQHQKESFRDYDSLPQAVFPTGFKTGLGKRNRLLETGHREGPGDSQSPSPTSFRGGGYYYPDEAFVVSPVRHHEHRDHDDTSAVSSPKAGDERDMDSEVQTTVGEDDKGEGEGGDTHSSNTADGNPQGSEAEGVAGADKQRRKICGMRRRWFWVIVATGVLISLIAILLGLFVPKLRQPQSNSVMFVGGLHPNTQLASVSWTTPDNRTQRAVVSQDWRSYLTVSYSDPDGSWKPVNVTGLLQQRWKQGGPVPSSFPPTPAVGTPLAAAVSSSSGFNIWFMGYSGAVMGVAARNLSDRESWDWTSATAASFSLTEGDRPTAITGSGIAAAIRRVCSAGASCWDDLYVAFLAADSATHSPPVSNYRLQLFNETALRANPKSPPSTVRDPVNWSMPHQIWYSNGPFPLAMTNYLSEENGDGTFGDMRLYFTDGDGSSQEMILNNAANDDSWRYGSTLTDGRLDRGAIAAGRLAVSSFDFGRQMLLVSTASDGTALAARHWAAGANATWTNQRMMNINGRPQVLNITSIAMTDRERRLYIRVNSTAIAEYEWAVEDPWTLVYQSTVNVFDMMPS